MVLLVSIFGWYQWLVSLVSICGIMILLFSIIIVFNNLFFASYRLQVNSEDDVKRITGTTCEIFSVKEQGEAGINTMNIKAMARRRFQVLSLRTQLDG